MDSITKSIVDFTTGLDPGTLPEPVIHDCKRRIIDTIGCALSAFDFEPARAARIYAMRTSVADGATVIGTAHRTLPELAAFANSVASRYIEGNDTFPGGGGHPSDCLLPILAVAESENASARTAIAAIVLAYEVHAYMFRAFPMRPHALDYVTYTAAASALGAAKILGLAGEPLANAISLSIVPNLALDISRRGHLSMWKGAAAANAARNGVAAAYMARAGMAGPATPFEGGLTEVVGAAKIQSFPLDPSTFAILRGDFKFFLSEYHAQSPAFAAIELHSQVKIEDIEKVEVFTYHFAWFEIGSGEEKWKPTTRETADHSLPYIVACVLMDGCYSDAIYTPARYSDPSTLDLMRRIAIIEDAGLQRLYPESFPCRMEITTKAGARKIAVVSNPTGHHNRPMSDDQIAEKFRALSGRKLGEAHVSQMLYRLWQFEAEQSIKRAFEEILIDTST